MKKKTTLTSARYTKLLKDVRRIIEEGKARATRAANEELILAYWQVGERISVEKLTENAGYGDAILEDLSEEIGIDSSTLKRCIYFFQTYNRAPSGTNLSWSHYRELLPLKDDTQRQWYEDLAEDEGLNVAQLTKVIKEDRYGQSQSGSKKSQKPTLRRPTEPTYVYKAIVERVIDGDTLLLRIDLGFQVSKEQRVRLAGIDTPAMDEPGGKEAYTYVLNQLAKVDFVMIKTNKIDIYGRYVGDIFYSFKGSSKAEIFAKGRYLNQELVEKGLARVF